MPLTHVFVWDSTKNTFVHTTPGQAAQDYRTTVSANKRVFFCKSCQKWVSFSCAEIQTPHFRHNGHDLDKECEDRARAAEMAAAARPIEQGLLPMRLKYEKNEPHIEIGFLPVSESAIEAAAEENAGVQIFCDGAPRQNKYAISPSRFSAEETIFYTVQGSLASRYELRLLGAGALAGGAFTSWIRASNTLEDNGTFFVASNGNRIADGGEVVVQTAYFVLERGSGIYSQSDVRVDSLCTCDGWKLYRITALAQTRSSCLFFFRFGLQLRSRQSAVTALWPALWEGDHTLASPARMLYLLTEGAVHIQSRKSHDSISEVLCGENHLVAVTRNSSDGFLYAISTEFAPAAMQYFYLRSAHTFHPAAVNITVCDVDGLVIPSGLQATLPPKQTIRISCPYAGRILRSQNSILQECIPVKADSPIQIDHLTENDVIRVIQGMDCYFTLGFVSSKPLPSIEEKGPFFGSHLYLPITRRAGTLYRRLDQNSRSAQLLKKAIRLGQIDRAELAQIVAQIRGNES